jgi:glycosyltransferase involved in cell wall biosynthesis
MNQNKKVLIVIPYEFYPPKGGGALLCFYTVKELSKYFQIAVVSNQNVHVAAQENNLFFQDIKFYHTDSLKLNFGIFKKVFPLKLLNFLFFKLVFKIRSGAVNAIFLNFFPSLTLALKEFCPDVVIFENLESLYYLNGVVRKQNSNIKIVYQAHNIDHILWKKLAAAENNKDFTQYSKNALEIESNLSHYIDCVIAVTKEDEAVLKKLNKINQHLLFANIACGVDVDTKIPSLQNIQSTCPKILFCGSLNYLPNIEGLKWFYEKVMPILRARINDFEIVIIGNCENLDVFTYLKGDPHINLVGRVEDVAAYYHESMLSIVPLLSGSGIRLKITESMSFGCPVISTTLGAEGITYDENSIVIADTPEQFADGIVVLLNNAALRNKLSKNGRLLVEQKYDWKILMSEFKEVIYSLY